MNEDHYPTIIKLRDVSRITGLSKSTIYNKLNKKLPYYDPEFPMQIKLGAKSVGWIAAEVFRWLESKSQERHARNGGV